MFKRFTHYTIKWGILLTFLVTGFISHAQAPKKGEYALLWKVTGNGAKVPSYLFGTMHMQDSRVFEFSDSVLVKLKECDAFAMEIHPDSLVGGRFSYMYYDEKGIPVQEVIADSSGRGLDVLKYETPYIINSFYERSSQMDLDMPVFLDAWLFNNARKQGKKVYSVELIEEHLNLAGSAASVAGINFRFDFDFFENEEDDESFIDIYRSGNIDKLDSLMHGNWWYGKKYLFELLYKRNFKMAERADKLIKKHSTFIAVGAAHLPGEHGLIKLLQRQGYTVERVPATFTGLRDKYKMEEVDIAWHRSQYPEYGYSIETPGRPYVGRERQDTFKIHPYIDLGNNVVYETFCVDYSHHKDKADAKKLTRKVVISLLESGEEDDQNNKFISKKEVVSKDGIKGTEFLIQLEDDSLAYFNLQVFHHNNRMYVNRVRLTKEYLDTRAVNKYFSSFRVYRPQPFSPKRQRFYVNEEGRFKVSFDKEPLRNEVVDYEEPGDTATAKTTRYYYINTNFHDHNVTYIMYGDYNMRFSGRSDSAILWDWIKSYHYSYYEDDDEKEPVLLETNGVPGIEWEYEDYSGTKTRMRCYLRGHRKFVIVNRQDGDSTKYVDPTPFFESFSFLPIKQKKGYAYTDKVQDLSVQLPSRPHIARDTITYYNGLVKADYETFYESIDQYSGSVFRVNVYELSDYYHAEHIDSFYTDLVAMYTDNMFDSSFTITDATLSGVDGKQIAVNLDSIGYRRHIRFVLMGDKLYKLSVVTSKEIADQPVIDGFFSSFKASGYDQSFALTQRKTDKLLKDLHAEDSITRYRAKQYLSHYVFEKKELAEVYNVLSKDFPDDTLNQGSVRIKLLSVLIDTNNTTTIPFLDSLYDATKAYPGIQVAILKTLSGITSEPSLSMFFEKLKDSVPQLKETKNKYGGHYDAYDGYYYEEYAVEEIDYYMMDDIYYEGMPEESGYDLGRNGYFKPFYDSLDLAKEYFPQLVQLGKHVELQPEVLKLVEYLISRDTELEEILLIANKDLFYSMARKSIADYSAYLETDSAKFETVKMSLRRLSELFALLPNDRESVDICETLLDFTDRRIQLNAAYALLRWEEQVPKKKMEVLFADKKYLQYPHLKKLHEADKMKKLPKNVKTQKYIAQAAFEHYLYENENYVPDSVAFIKVKTVTFEEEKVNVYAFKYTNGGQWELGISGPYPVDKKELSFDNLFTTNSYYEFDEATYEEDLDELIQEQVDQYEDDVDTVESTLEELLLQFEDY